MARTNVEISSVNITVPTEMISYVAMKEKDMVLQRNAWNIKFPFSKFYRSKSKFGGGKI